MLNGNFLRVQFTENECKLHVKCSVAIYSDVQCFESQIKTANYKSFLNFFNLVVLFLNFQKIEPTVSYKKLSAVVFASAWKGVCTTFS